MVRNLIIVGISTGYNQLHFLFFESKIQMYLIYLNRNEAKVPSVISFITDKR